MKTIIIAAGTGFMGRHISKHFLDENWNVIVLTRNPIDNGIRNYKEIHWDAKKIADWSSFLDGSEIVLNLTGKSVDCRYTEKNKAEIINSRVDSTKVLHKVIATCKTPPKLWINASTATIYRDSRDKEMTEANGEIGADFSMGVAKKWEKSFFEKKLNNTRQVALRTSLVLGKDGGVLGPLINLVKFRLGGHHGDGQQKFAWIHIDDVVGIIKHIYENENLRGAINCTAPSKITNADFMGSLRKVLSIKWGLNHPKWMLSMGAIFIGTETELILKSRWVYPEIILNSGYTFKYRDELEALQSIV